jgi:hypothetical protein
MFYQSFNWIDSWRGVISRQIVLLHRVAHRIFRPEERYEMLIDHDGLGVWVGVVSSRPEALLKAIKQEAFPTFAFAGVRNFGDQRNWTHFRAL